MYKSAEALLSRLNSLPAKHRDVLREYYENDVLNGISHRTCENKILELILFVNYVNKPFKEVTRQDIKSYLLKRKNELQPSSLSTKKSIIKNFFKWFYKSDNYPEIVSWIRTGYSSYGNDFPSGVRTPNEVKLIIKEAEKVQHKTIIAVL